MPQTNSFTTASRLKFLATAIVTFAVVWYPACVRADDTTIPIMTQNVYQGTNFVEVLSAKTTAQFLAAVTETYDNIVAANAAAFAGAKLHVVMAGDFNAHADDSSDPTFTTYQAAIDAGFGDAWTLAHENGAGFTCCQAQDLMNPASPLDQRIDLFLASGGVGVDDIRLIGDSQTDRTPSRLWPADHAGLVATLEIPESAVTIPEPSTWVMFLLGFGSFSLAGYRSRVRSGGVD